MTPEDRSGQLIAGYRLEARIGAGGMGEVYRAHDAKLDRTVALKLLPGYLAADPERLRRFHAEAKAASSLNHPNILVVHDFGEHDGRPFMVTEFVDGQTLRERLAAGPMPILELLDVARQIASALAAAHERGVMHRDIKPENVMVRPDALVKVVDFGLAKPAADDQSARTRGQTSDGLIMGTPQYMSPEQARGERVDFRSDQFSLGAVLYELASGRAPFARDSAVEAAAAVIADEADPVDRARPQITPALGVVIHRCLSKKPADRYHSTRLLHDDIVSALQQAPVAETPPAPARDAIVVLPLKILRGRPDADFLAFSLPDAIASTLAERGTIAVRSPLAAQRHGGAEADLSSLAQAMSAQFALTGTFTCLDERIAVRLQLLAIPSGTVVWSDSRVTSLHELFDLQDAVASQVARALPAGVKTSATPAPPGREGDVSKDAGAYAFYLRANQLAYEVSRWSEARDLYHASIEADPDFAPAWARLARCERLLGKYSASPAESRASAERAEHAFQRALDLNPDLSIGHTFYAQLLVDGGRADEAMARLLERISRRPAEPEPYAGLVHALRYCGLLDASVAAHVQAHALDPTMPTSVHHTWWMRGEYDRALSETFATSGTCRGWHWPRSGAIARPSPPSAGGSAKQPKIESVPTSGRCARCSKAIARQASPRSIPPRLN